MFRFVVATAIIALSAGPALANGHRGEAPPPPKPDATNAPAKVVLTKQGPTLVDLKGTRHHWKNLELQRQVH